MPSPSLPRVRRHRLRQAGILPPVPLCSCCGGQVKGQGRDGLCSRCWRRSPAGRAADAERKRQARKAKAPQA